MSSRLSLLSIIAVLSLPFAFQVFSGFSQDNKSNQLKNSYLGLYTGGNIGKDLHLELKEDGIFIFTKSDGDDSETSKGTYNLSKTKLKLNPEKKSLPFGDQFIVCHWDSTTLLVPKKRIIEFCNDLNQGRNGSRYALRSDEWLDRFKSKPQLPKKYQKYLLKDILRGEVIKVKGKKTAIINLGMEDGLLPKLSLLTFRTDEEIMENGESSYTHQIHSAIVLECFKNKSVIYYPKNDHEFELGQEVFSRLTLFKGD